MLNYHKSIILKPCKGLGDAIYAYPVAKYLSQQHPNLQIKVLSKYWQVFHKLPVSVIDQDDRNKFDVDCTYLNRKQIKSTNQFQDVCINANIPELPFHMDWAPTKSYDLPDKKLCLIRSPYLGMELRRTPVVMPDMSFLEYVLPILKEQYHVVLLKHHNDGCNYNLPCDQIVTKTTIFELFDWIYMSDLIIGQLGHVLAAAEAFGKKMFVVYPEATLKSHLSFFNSITPEKVISKPTTDYMLDSCLQKLDGRDLFLQKINDLCRC